MTLHGLGDMRLFRGDSAAASELYLVALRLSIDQRVAAQCLAGLAAAAALEYRVDSAGRAWGAVEAYEERLGEELMLPDTLRRYLPALETIVGEAFAAAVAAGRRLMLEDAAREVLEAGVHDTV